MFVDHGFSQEPLTDCETELAYLLNSQGCVMSPLLYSLYTHDCTSLYPTNTIIKFADDTTFVGLISNCNEVAYRDEMCILVEWCTDNNLSLNIKKTKELVIDFRRHRETTSALGTKERGGGESVQF